MINSTSLAAGNFVGVKNEQFAVTAKAIAQKNVIIGTYDETTYTSITPNKPIRVYSADEVGAKTGFGFMLHRLAKAAFKGGAVETWIIPQEEIDSDFVNALGSIAFAGSTGVVAGTLNVYIAGERVTINTTKDETADQLATALASKINADVTLPVTAVASTSTVNLTSKSGGTFGNDISINISLGSTDVTPAGVTAVITAMHNGAGVPDIQDALDALGTGDGQNENFFTNLIHGYGYSIPTLDAISTYNGLGNDYVGNYAKECARPFRSLIGNTTKDTAGLSALIAIGVLRKETDRTNGIIAVPGSANHPQEIAAQALNKIAYINSTLPQVGYIDQALDGVWTGDTADRWTNDYDNRDTAVKNGISTTLVKNGIVYMQNIVTFYHPASVAVESNSFRQFKNISIKQNIMSNWKANFDREKWKGIFIVTDSAKVTDTDAKAKARDVDSVKDDVVALIDAFYKLGWIYDTAYSKANFTVTLRAGLTGFDVYCPFIPSGEGGIYNTDLAFDTSITILGGNA